MEITTMNNEIIAPISSISRRSFLALAGAAPFALAMQKGQNIPVGLELYSVRDELAKDLMGTVRAVAKMGYEVVEFFSPYYQWTPDYAKEVRKLLDDLKIRCLSTHNGANAFTPEGLQKAIELNQILGAKYVVMASAGRVEGLDGWKGVAERLTQASENARRLPQSQDGIRPDRGHAPDGRARRQHAERRDAATRRRDLRGRR